MKNYIFLTNYYLPRPGATGVCIHQLAKEIKKHGNDCTVICYHDEQSEQIIDGVKIERIDIPFYLNTTKKQGYIRRWIHRVLTILQKGMHILKYPLKSNKLVSNYLNSLKVVIGRNVESVVIASYTPLESVIAAKKIKDIYPNVKIVFYSTDSLSNERGGDGFLSPKLREFFGLRWEYKLFPFFDKILIMENHKNHYYYSGLFKNYISKMEIVNFPLIIKPSSVSSISKNVYRANGVINIVYAGTLYKVLRNPQYACDLFTQVLPYLKLQVIFVGGGDCDDILKKAELTSEGRIKGLGFKPYNIAISYIEQADVLLSIGNADSPMAPSKIYEYMSTGKPIIHIYTYEKDPCLDPLQKYTNAIIIKNDDQTAVRRIINFLRNSNKIEFEEIEQIFISSTPRYSTRLIERL